MTSVIRIVRRSGRWLIELDGDYFGPCSSADEAFGQASVAALKLRMDCPRADIRIVRLEARARIGDAALRRLTDSAKALGFQLSAGGMPLTAR
jgi:hypothetical protein